MADIILGLDTREIVLGASAALLLWIALRHSWLAGAGADDSGTIKLAALRALEREATLRDLLRNQQVTPLELYLRSYQRTRRRARLSSLLPISAIKAPPRLSWLDWPANASDPRFTFNRLRRCLVWAAAAGFAAVGTLGLYAYVGPTHTLLTKANINLTCVAAAAVRNPDGTVSSLIVSHGEDGCERQFRTTRFEEEEALAIAEAIGVLEGRWRTWNSLLGIDVVGLAKHVGSKLGVNLGRGGSAPLVSAFEVAIGRPDPIRSTSQKIDHLLATVQFVARELPGDTARARYLSENMPAVVGLGDPLAGRLAAEVLFGSAPRNSSERCMFAAAAGFPIFIGATPGNAFATSWQRARRRAAACVKELEPDAESRAKALRKLAELPMPNPKRYASLGFSSRAALRGALRETGRDVEPEVYQTTLDPRAQALLREGVREFRERRGFAKSVNHLVAVAEIEPSGLWLKVVSTNQHGSLYGFHELRDGMLQRKAYGWRLASVNKILVALPPSAAGETSLCNRRHGAFRNPNGDGGVRECSAETGEGFVTALVAMGRSLNLPFIYAARRHLEALGRLHNHLGFIGDGGRDPAAAAVYGYGPTAAPAIYMNLFAHLATNRPMGLSPIRFRQIRPVELDSIGYRHADTKRVMDWLRRPVQAGGTLNRAAVRIDVPECQIEAGKSGTDKDDGVLLGKVQLWLARCTGGRRLVLFAMMQAAPTDALALSHSQLADLSEAALRAVMQAP